MNTEKDEPYARLGVVEQQILSNCPPSRNPLIVNNFIMRHNQVTLNAKPLSLWRQNVI